MIWKNTNSEYGFVAKCLHVLVAIMVFGQLAGGFWYMNAPNHLKAEIYAPHKLSGMLILLLMIIRVSWRMANVLPDLPADVPEFRAKTARFVHRLLYLLLFIMPLSGWAMATLAGHPPIIPGIGPFMFPLLEPRVICVFGTPYSLIKIMKMVHFYTGCSLALLLIGHISIGMFQGKEGLNRMFGN